MPDTLTLFYDGLCPLCSREITHYRRRLAGTDAVFVDIADPHFDPAKHGVNGQRVHRIMHVKVGEELRLGVDAFLAIWDAIPRYRKFARVARWPGVNQMLKVGYFLFARVRPWLPRRKQTDCQTGTCTR